MNKIIIFLLLSTLGFSSCKNSETKIDKLEIAKQYYKALDNSDDFGIVAKLTDSIIIRESDYNYEEHFSQNGFVEWLKWDAVFNPTYKILEIEQENEIIRAKISKIDKRIYFLHGEPIVSTEIIRFDHHKIIKVEKTYAIFNEAVFLKNRDRLVRFIDKKHPELNGFLYDQTKVGGENYLKAIELYKKNNLL